MQELGSVWQAALRRRDNLQALRQLERKPIPDFMQGKPSTLEMNAAQKLAHDLAALEPKKQQHLQEPAVKEQGMGKLSIVGIVLGLAFMGALFFICGFLTCYTLFPPSHRIESIHAPHVPLDTHPASYAHRQNSMNVVASQSPANRAIVARAEDQAIGQARFQTQSVMEQAINSVSSGLRDKIGSGATSIIAPLTTGIASSAAQSATNQAFSGARASVAASNTAAPIPAKPGAATTPTATSAAGPGAQEAHTAPQTSPAPAFYAIEVRTFDDGQEALAFQKELDAAGFHASYVVRTWAQKRVIFKVRAGDFGTFQEAADASKILENQNGVPARVVLIRPDENRVS